MNFNHYRENLFQALENVENALACLTLKTKSYVFQDKISNNQCFEGILTTLITNAYAQHLTSAKPALIMVLHANWGGNV